MGWNITGKHVGNEDYYRLELIVYYGMNLLIVTISFTKVVPAFGNNEECTSASLRMMRNVQVYY